jgi:Flp pilus assembly protein CpaB
MTSALFLCAAPLLLALAAHSSQKDNAAEPQYDTATNIDVMVVVVDVKDVPVGSPLNGTHLMVRPEMSKNNSETTDVYLAPDDYLKDFGCHFAKGDRIQVKGSKVRFNGAAAVLAREVRLEATTVYLRDDHGVPYWKT